VAKKLKGFRTFVLVLYIVITFIETPEWCLDNKDISDPWFCQDKKSHFINSGLPKIPRWISLPIDLVILLMLIGFKLMGRLYKHHNKSSKRLESIQLGLMTISILDIVLDLVLYPMYRFPYLACYIRPIVFSITMRSLREQWKRYLYVIMDSA
jgi:hypothetical protein